MNEDLGRTDGGRTYDADFEVVRRPAEQGLLLDDGLFGGHSLLCKEGRGGGEEGAEQISITHRGWAKLEGQIRPHTSYVRLDVTLGLRHDVPASPLLPRRPPRLCGADNIDNRRVCHLSLVGHR